MATTGPTGPTVGLEEELHVADATSGRLTSRAPEVLQGLSDPLRAAALAEHGAVVGELTRSQIETVTAVATSVDTVTGKALALRGAAAGQARERGLTLLASGTPVLGDAAEQRVSADPRYRALRRHAAGLVDHQLIAGMHVHVGVGPAGPVEAADDDLRVAVVDTLRPWLPALLALTANSPYWLGRDTGFASYRQVHWQRWPVAGPPPFCQDASGYARAVAALVDAAVVDDASFVYWDLRLATRYPTVEVRVSDVAPTMDDAAVLVALVRGLTAHAIAEHEAGRHADDVPLHALRAASWRAARYGLTDRLVDPTSAGLAPAREVLQRLARHAQSGLEATGDVERAQDGLARVLRDGNGADRQRRAFARRGWPGVLDVVRVDVGAARVVAAAHGDGNGWVRCQAGHRHWGRHGAAGLLVVRPGPGGPQVLLQLRAGWTHQGGTWGVPGGARDSHESVSQAARREALEEAGVDGDGLIEVAQVVDDHGAWSYTYVVVTAPAQAAAFVANAESDAVAWVGLDDVAGRPLHPALAETWSRLRATVDGLDRGA